MNDFQIAIATARAKPPILHQCKTGLLRSQTVRSVRLAKYLDESMIPDPPPSWDGFRGGQASPQMYGNDHFGDCTIAGLANHARMRAALDGQPLPDFTDGEILTYYQKQTGGPDTGLAEEDVLQNVVQNGFPGDGRYRFHAQVRIDLHNDKHLAFAAATFGGLYLGLALPLRAQSQGQHWEVEGDGATGDAAPASWGDHCVILSGYDQTPSPWDRLGQPVGNVSLLTWGDVIYATRHWLSVYAFEAYALLDEAHLQIPGIDGKALLADLALLAA